LPLKRQYERRTFRPRQLDSPRSTGQLALCPKRDTPHVTPVTPDPPAHTANRPASPSEPAQTGKNRPARSPPPPLRSGSGSPPPPAPPVCGPHVFRTFPTTLNAEFMHPGPDPPSDQGFRTVQSRPPTGQDDAPSRRPVRPGSAAPLRHL